MTDPLRNVEAEQTLLGTILLRVDGNLSAALASYIDVFRAITGISDRTISCESGGTSAFLSEWRRGNNKLTLNQYQRIVAYMDRTLMEQSGVEFDKLGGWINRKLRAMSDEQLKRKVKN